VPVIGVSARERVRNTHVVASPLSGKHGTPHATLIMDLRTDVELDAAALALSVDTLWQLAWCGQRGYRAASRQEAVWARCCNALRLPRSRYDRSSLDTVSRCLRQAAYMYCETPVWHVLSAVKTVDLAIQRRAGPGGARLTLAWDASGDAPWFAVVQGELRVFPRTSGARREAPSARQVAAAIAAHAASAEVDTVKKTGPARRARKRPQPVKKRKRGSALRGGVLIA